jgi:uncharacterized protein
MSESNGCKSINRRDFLKLGVVGAASTALAISGIQGVSESEAQTNKPFPDPVYRTLGRTGLKLTVVSFGAMLTPEHEVMEVAFDHGINYVDTARRYMNGRNEAIVARALKGRRDKMYVATKIPASARSKKEIFRDVETSLTELQTDHIDVIQLHGLDKKDRAFMPENREALLELRQQGKVRFFGVTTHTNQAEVVNALADDPDKFFDTALVGYNFQSSPQIKQAIARAAKTGIGIIAMKTQSGGYKTDALGPISPHQAALKWVLQDTNVTAAIPGMKNTSHLTECIAVMGMRLTRSDQRILERYADATRPYYCHLCAECEPTCPNNVAVSVINRSIMYAEAYGSMELARSTYEEIPYNASASACLGCPECAAKCVRGIDIGAKMEKALKLFA